MDRIGVALAMTLWFGTAHAAERLVVLDDVGLEDADTLLVEVDGEGYRIQLPDVDAPESSENPKLQRDVARTGEDPAQLLALGRAADEGLRGLLAGFRPYRLRFDPTQRDKYGRTPGDLIDADGRLLSERLVEAGLGIPMASAAEARRAPLDAAMTQARDARRGLWGSQPALFAHWAAVPPR